MDFTQKRLKFPGEAHRFEAVESALEQAINESAKPEAGRELDASGSGPKKFFKGILKQ